MKLKDLRQVIREEVRSAMKEELQEIMNEAVKAASTPIGTVAETKSVNITPTATPVQSADPIMEMLNQTKANMTQTEYKNVYSGTSDMVQKPNFASMMANNMGMTANAGPAPGLDISQFDFVKKAGQVYNKSIENDKAKQGLV
jgi:hypothetical protein